MANFWFKRVFKTHQIEFYIDADTYKEYTYHVFDKIGQAEFKLKDKPIWVRYEPRFHLLRIRENGMCVDAYDTQEDILSYFNKRVDSR
jgi:hypothetical protein